MKLHRERAGDMHGDARVVLSVEVAELEVAHAMAMAKIGRLETAYKKVIDEAANHVNMMAEWKRSVEAENKRLRAAIEEFGCQGCTMHPCPPDCWVKVALGEA